MYPVCVDSGAWRASRHHPSVAEVGLHVLAEDRERSVLTLLAEGRSNRSIADKLMLSIKTIEAAMASVFSKLDLEPDPDNNRRVLAVLAYLDSNRESTSPERAG